MIDNAFKYSAYGSEIAVILDLNPEIITFSVTNTSPTPVDFSKYFDSFQKSESKTSFLSFKSFAVPNTSEQGGVGIGLGVAYNSLKLMNSELILCAQDDW